MSRHFDFVVIGGGSAGYAAARTAVSAGLKTAIIDGAKTLGGLCILRGCMPSKTLIESANRNLIIRRAKAFGLSAQAGEPDVLAIRNRKRTLIDDFAGYRQGQLQDGRFELIRGLAQFVDGHRFEVQLQDGTREMVSFRFACVATGSRVSVPPIPGLVESGFWTSDDILDTDSLPKSFVVLGGGAIALEMTHYLEALGRRVTLIQRSGRLLNFMDSECGEAVAADFRDRGIEVCCGTKVTQIEQTSAGKQVTFEHDGTIKRALADQIFVATGRVASLDGLNLEKAGIELENGKLRASSTMQTSAPHIFAAGDVVDSMDVVHIAIQEGEIAARNAAALNKGSQQLEEIDHRLMLFGVFCDPQVAAVGATEAELTAKGIPYATASYPFNDHGKSLIMGVKHGFVKMLAHRESGEILGASVVGPEATELIHEIVVAMNFRCTVQQFMAIPHYHPTLSEIWTYPAEELAAP